MSVHSLDRAASESLGALHREAISAPGEIRAILRQASSLGTILRAGVNRRVEARTAMISRIDADSMLLDAANIRSGEISQIYFTFDLESGQYFFACSIARHEAQGRVRVSIPASLYRAERREMERGSLPALNVTVVGRGSDVWSCVEAVDRTRSGLGLRLPAVASCTMHL